jgi:lipoprotein-anchoring transpeptidase ErfK/SrfK
MIGSAFQRAWRAALLGGLGLFGWPAGATPPAENNPKSAKSTTGPAPQAEPHDATPASLPPRITSVAIFTKIYPVPGRMGVPLGMIHVGGSVPLRDTTPLRRNDCRGGWYAVEPRGYVCLDTTTLVQGPDRTLSEGAERYLRALATSAATTKDLPFGYALSLGTPMYGRIPTKEEQAQKEAELDPPPVGPLGSWAAGHDGLAVEPPLSAAAPPPPFFDHGEFSPVYVQGKDARLVRRFAPRGTMLSFGSKFQAEGRSWLVTPELSIVPADRVRAYRVSQFQGLALDHATQLPVAWIRARPRPKFRRDEAGRLVASTDTWEVRSPVRLTGTRVVDGGQTYLETSEAGAFLAAADAVVVEKRRRRPPAVRANQKWILVSISKGTLTAYVGDEPVYATLVSPGQGGIPEDIYVTTRELVARHATPLGVYRIQYKDRYAVMSPDPEQKKFWIADVPYVQYFRGPFALHGAYWHENFGELKSGGCINLSPADAKWLFGWTDPPVPDSWQGAQASGQNGRGTVIQVIP